MHLLFQRSTKTATRSLALLPKTPPSSSSSYSHSTKPIHDVGSHSRVQKLIASQSDPPFAKEIFDYTAYHPNFRHSYAFYFTLILKLGWSKYFSLVDDLLLRIRLEFQNYIPSIKHLNRIIQILVSHQNFLPQVFNSYRILMQGLCRKGQVNIAVDFFEDMLNKGFVSDTLSYMTLLNSLCRNKKLREEYKLPCRMKVKGCNPNIVHYNTVILGVMVLNVGRFEEACGVLEEVLNHREVPRTNTWITVVPRICEEIELVRMEEILREVMKVELRPNTRIMEAAFGLEDYLIKKI
ncbi:pentatricopeptide repeat-containing protein [Pyrus ussuriensis x Pyrus communis]|uniref:Pentatricopeptide repeat-containing protein n=1 Tax=Pyrus ussuriensis x Pyrus communis TaxID=2448454 RepID=A0A5N5EYU1_9ROSA|nr:pentatricopeptide repeat-containing protein [Pyrus ussuriensis x Pyrus communis]